MVNTNFFMAFVSIVIKTTKYEEEYHIINIIISNKNSFLYNFLKSYKFL